MPFAILRSPMLLALSVAGALLAQPAASADNANALLGRWLTDNGNLEVEIAPCGAAMCGTVVKVLANRSMSGSGEMKAADPRSPLGMKVLIDFVRSGDNTWQGEIYNRENAKTYSCKITAESPDQLVVRPYVGLSLFGKDLVWRRATASAVKR